MGWRPLAHKRRTRSSVSSPSLKKKSIQVMARRSQAACHSFFTVRRATWDCERRSTALVLTRTSRTQSRLRGTPVFANKSRPARVAIAPSFEAMRDASRPALCSSLCLTGIKYSTELQLLRPSRFDCTAVAAAHAIKDEFRFRLDTTNQRGYATARFHNAIICTLEVNSDSLPPPSPISSGPRHRCIPGKCAGAPRLRSSEENYHRYRPRNRRCHGHHVGAVLIGIRCPRLHRRSRKRNRVPGAGERPPHGVSGQSLRYSGGCWSAASSFSKVDHCRVLARQKWPGEYRTGAERVQS